MLFCDLTDSTPALRSEPEPLADSDYDTILAAVMETARGRWFLSEFAHRNRNTDTKMVLTAISRLESLLKTNDLAIEPLALAGPVQAPGEFSRILGQLRDIAESLVECGAPTYLCSDLNRGFDQLAAAFVEVANTTASVATMPDVTAAEVAAPTPDPFSDILALSPEERIALFT